MHLLQYPTPYPALMGDSGDEAEKAPPMSLGEMLLAEGGAGAAADWVNRSKKMEAIRSARQEREARRPPGVYGG
jgi:hypothetical protein